MQSMHLTLAKEFLWQIRWPVLMGLFGSCFYQFLMMAVLRFFGHDPADQAYREFQVSFQTMTVPLSILVLAIVVVGTQTQLGTRVYTLPIPTTMIVNSRMIPGMLLSSSLMWLSNAALNVIFDLNWPLAAPSLFAAVVVGAAQATLWYSEKSPLAPFCFAIVGGFLGVWYDWRCHWRFSGGTPSMWEDVTPGDGLTFFVVASVSYVMAHVGMARSRCGGILGSDGFATWIASWLTNPFDAISLQRGGFQTPQQAFFWSEWRLKGWAFPITVSAGLAFGLSKWVFSHQDAVELIRSFQLGGAFLSGLGLGCGWLLGNYGPKDDDTRIGPFLGSRPLSDNEFSWTTLHVAARSVLIGWSLWAVPFACVALLVLMRNEPAQLSILFQLPWWYVPSTLLGSWIAIGISLVLMLTGRRWLVVQVIVISIAIAIIFILLPKIVSAETFEKLSSASQSGMGIAMSVGSLWAMATAKRRSLISTNLFAAMGVSWGVLAIAVIIACGRHFPTPLPSTVLFIGVASLVVSPLATAPLAIAWNRHR